MKVIKTPFAGLFILEPVLMKDNRGFFFESYNKKSLQQSGINVEFVQDNQSFSVKNVIRGLHFQRPPHAQVKLVRALSGVIMDVVVDLRKDQPTYKKSFSIEISAENCKQVFVPVGFAHGFSVLSASAEIQYKCNDHYFPPHEGGIIFSDPDLNIDWKVNTNEALVSNKDMQLPLLSGFSSPF